MSEPIDAGPDIEVVRGDLSSERAEQLLDFWSSHGALLEAEARRRLPEAVCVLLDGGGAVVGASSVYEAEVSLVGGRRFWVYRSFMASGFSDSAAAMFRASFAALEAEFDPTGLGPVGLCLLLAEPSERRLRPEAEWQDPRTLYAGYLADGRQVRIAYFARSAIGDGKRPPVPSAAVPPLAAGPEGVWTLEDGYRIALLGAQEAIDDQAVIDLWLREGVLALDEAYRRVSEVLLVATSPSGDLAGVSTAYLEYNAQLRMEIWYYRAFVATPHRNSQLSVALALVGRDYLSGRFVSGEDTRAAGVIFEIEHEGWKRYGNAAVWLPSDVTFIGENERGDHVRVRYFPGAIAPEGTAQGST